MYMAGDLICLGGQGGLPGRMAFQMRSEGGGVNSALWRVGRLDNGWDHQRRDDDFVSWSWKSEEMRFEADLGEQVDVERAQAWKAPPEGPLCWGV